MEIIKQSRKTSSIEVFYIMKNKKDASSNIIEQYSSINIMTKEEILNEKQVSITGLSSSQVDENKLKYGANEIRGKKPKKWYNYLIESLISPFNLILLGIVLILCYTDIYLQEKPSYANIIVILILVTISTLLEFFEVFKSNRAAEKLKEMVATTATVIRNGEETKIPIKEVTVGDIVKLAAGDMIPADLKIIEVKDLYVGQSALTGESDSVRKVANTEFEKENIQSVADLDTIAFMGTNVISGSAKGVVIQIADSTYFGRIADTLAAPKEKSSFEIAIQNISKLLIKFMLILIPIVFFINLNKHGTLIAFTFAVAIAIGITPLLLPVILSSTLSKGAVKMSKKKTIVKKLDSIQNFGGMNILCTDKTGTLTLDKIVLEKYINIKGEEDQVVLKHAFLNSYFQTGLRDSIDEAVIARGLKNGMSDYTTRYKKIDEIPFDFTRRRLSVVVTDGQKKQLITKGAVEEILSICSLAEYKGQVSPMTNEIKNNIKRIAKELNKQGLRVIAVCQKNDINNIENFEVKHEKDMVLKGFVGFLDPPKDTAKESISKLNKAGIRTIVLTGDNADVTRCICEKVGINSNRILVGSDIEKMTDQAVLRVLRDTNIFAKLSPVEKARIVRLLKQDGNIVGYMGDGINDSPSLMNSDVGISVDTAVDIAKESADIILLEKDLNVLLDGVEEGRKTFGNLMKYIKMATSFNFGEVVSVIIASIFLPFLPETPIQLLAESLLYDCGQLMLPFDNVDKEYLKKPRRLDVKKLKQFMLFMGPLSSIFDIVVFVCLWFAVKVRTPELFQTVWFSYTIISNLIGMHIIRTSRKAFVESNASKLVYASTVIICLLALIVPLTGLGAFLGLVPIPVKEIGLIFGTTVLYCVVASFAKRLYVRKFGEWI